MKRFLIVILILFTAGAVWAELPEESDAPTFEGFLQAGAGYDAEEDATTGFFVFTPLLNVSLDERGFNLMRISAPAGVDIGEDEAYVEPTLDFSLLNDFVYLGSNVRIATDRDKDADTEDPEVISDTWLDIGHHSKYVSTAIRGDLLLYHTNWPERSYVLTSYLYGNLRDKDARYPYPFTVSLGPWFRYLRGSKEALSGEETEEYTRDYLQLDAVVKVDVLPEDAGLERWSLEARLKNIWDEEDGYSGYEQVFDQRMRVSAGVTPSGERPYTVSAHAEWPINHVDEQGYDQDGLVAGLEMTIQLF